MDPLIELLRGTRAESDPNGEWLARVRARLDRTLVIDRGVVGMMRGLGAPDPSMLGRLRARLVGMRGARRVPITRLALAAAIGIAAVGIAATLSARPGDDALSLDLEAEIERTLAASDDVQLTFAGHGRARGSRRAPRIAWEHGHIGLEVTPGHGIDLVVSTPEAEVAVVGTVFEVTRDALGTTVGVTRGEVRVRCRSGEAHALRASDAITCTPVDSAGLLGRAWTLQRRGHPIDEVLATLDAALVAPGEASVRGEILAKRTRLLLDAGRPSDAVATARRYLAEGHQPRRDEMHALVSAYAPDAPEVIP